MTMKTLINRMWLKWGRNPAETKRMGQLMMWVVGLPRAK